MYDVFDIAEQKYLSPPFAREVAFELGIPYVPVINVAFELPERYCDELLAMAHRESCLAPYFAEGLVFKANSVKTDFSFKAIGNFYAMNDKKSNPYVESEDCQAIL